MSSGVQYKIPMDFLTPFVTGTELDYAISYFGGVLPFVLALEASALGRTPQRTTEAIAMTASMPNVGFEKAAQKVFELFVPTYKNWFVQRHMLSSDPIVSAVLIDSVLTVQY